MRERVAHIRVALELLGHHRLAQIPKRLRMTAMGVWLWATLYSRCQELDGRCQLLPLYEAGATQEIISWLERVGLVSRYEEDGVHGVILARYSEFNETKADVAARKASQNARQSKHRAPDVTRDSRVTPALVTPPIQSNTNPDLKITPVVPSPGTGPSSSIAVATGKRQRTSKPGTQVPADGDVDGMATWCLLWGIPHDHPKLGRMLDWARAKGIVRKDWKAQWRNWLASPFADTEPARQRVFGIGGGGSGHEVDPEARRRQFNQRLKDLDREGLQRELEARRREASSPKKIGAA